MARPLRIGIAGARGIGRHQAKWYAQLGCEVSAVYGTTSDSAAAAAAGMRALFPFAGRVESDWERFVGAPDLDAISICSPPEAHAANVISALRAGKHALCEKPLVWNWTAGADEMLASAREMARSAEGAGRVLAVNAQYPAAAVPLLELYRAANGQEPAFQRLLFRMETAGPPRSPHGAAEVWADLGPHPLAFLDRLLPGGTADLGSVCRHGSDREAVVQLDWKRKGQRIPVTLELRRIQERSAVRREFVLDGWTAAYSGRNRDGEFCSVLAAPPHEWIGEDFMRTSIRQFIAAATAGDPSLALLSAPDALRQFELQVAIWQRCFQ